MLKSRLGDPERMAMLIEFHRRMLADTVRSAAFEAALRRVIKPGVTTVADIGAGTGVLGFMAQKLGAREVHLIEHGPVIGLAERLADDNHIPGLHFWPAHSAEIIELPQVDVVVAEILGNFALEETALETLADAHRFLRPGGVVIPLRLEQFVAPIVTDRLWRELGSWRDVLFGLDFSSAQAMSFDNIYVQRIGTADLPGSEDVARCWDRLEFTAQPDGRRRGQARWEWVDTADVFGLALWWRCELVPGVSLTTSPFAAPTHWDQVHAPIAVPVRARAGDVIDVVIESETGGGEAGIGLRWTVSHVRDGRELSNQQHDIGRGHLG